jgi:hypothetical protein
VAENHKSSQRHEEQQGPASLQVGGPSAGYSLKELGQPIHSQNAEAVMKAKQQNKEQ